VWENSAYLGLRGMRNFFILSFICFFGCSVEQKNTVFTVVSYNIHHGNPPAFEEENKIFLDSIVKSLSTLNPDIVFLQEVDSFTIRSLQTHQAAEVAGDLGMYFHFFSAIPYEGGSYGIAILSKFPILETQQWNLPSPLLEGAEPRVLSRVAVQIDNDTIHFYNTHLDALDSHSNRAAQVLTISEILKGNTHPYILGGDFNASPSHPLFSPLEKSNIHTNPLEIPTYPANDPKECIDHFWLSHQKFEVLKFWVGENETASDHRPIALQVRLSGRKKDY